MEERDLLAGVEEIGMEVKKVVKKKIIKKIVKRRNADGTEMPPEVTRTTVLVEPAEVTQVESLTGEQVS